MEVHTTKKFFHEFVKEIRKDIKRVGIITDKDGTILLDDSLRRILQDFNEKKLGAEIFLIANSGRTVQDMINCLQDESIPIEYFDYIIGDNGGMCLDVARRRIQYKHTIDENVVSKVVEMFLKLGGQLEDIRLADGRSIYAYPTEDVRKYYKGSKDIVFKEDILDLEGIDITKLTITGPHDLINRINKKIRESIKGYRTHVGKSSFPTKDRNNYRIDFTRNAYKRRGCKKVKRAIKIRYMHLSRK